MEQWDPCAAVAARLLPHSGVSQAGDGAHDLDHIGRVWTNAFGIAAAEGVETEAEREDLAASVMLHDCVAVAKNDPRRSQASRLAAAQAELVLAAQSWPQDRVAGITHAICAHSFSAGIAPQSRIARILQDADRLDAIGMIGVARCFYTAGRMGSALYNPEDPRAERRSLDDRAYALDHFRAKLLHLQEGFQTATGRALAAARTQLIADFMAAFEAELGMPAARV